MFRTDCPAFNKKCGNCGKENHFEKVCEQRRRYRASFIRNEDDTTPGESEDSDEYDYNCDASEGEESGIESHLLSTTKLKDFRHASSLRPFV